MASGRSGALVDIGRASQISLWLMLAIGAALWVGPAVYRLDIFDGDSAHHVFWLYQYADPALFANDLSAQYLRTSAPLGYRAMAASIAPFFDLLATLEFLSAGLFILAGWLAWKVGTALEGPGCELRGLLAVLSLYVMQWLAWHTDLLPAMAFQRTFALPLLLLCLWALMTRRYAWVGISWVLAALFYPVVLPVQGLTAGCVFLRDIVVEKKMPPQWILNGGLAVAALALAILGVPKIGELGPAATYTQAIAMPEFGPDGRLDLYGPGAGSLGGYFWHPMTGLGWSPRFLLAILVFAGIATVLKQRRLVPFAAWAMLGVGVGLWVLLRLFPHVLMFGLYLPNRHSRWAIAAFGIVAFTAGAYALLQRARPEKATYAVCLAGPVLAVAMLIPHALGVLRKPVDGDLEKTYAFIATLPKDTVIGAYPDVANYIPVRTRRSVLASTETSMPWMIKYYSIMKGRLESELRASYATNISEMDSQMAPYGVNVFVIGPQAFAAKGYLQPFDAMAKALLARGRKEGFALQSPPADRVLFRSGDYYVLQVHRPQ
jgi:hypothetical protein